MRYRPFGSAGLTVSAVALALGARPESEAARVRLVYAALESGINGFELREPGAAKALGQALQALERRMVMVWLRLSGAHRLDADAVVAAVEQPLLAGRFGRLDAVIVEDPVRLTADGWAALSAAREAGRTGAIGVSGEGAAEALRRPEVEVYGARHHLATEWSDRNQIRAAVAAGCTIVGHGHMPALRGGPDEAPVRRGLFGLSRKPAPLERQDGYGFLGKTPNWTAEQICLAYALTEPCLATIAVEASAPEDLEGLAAVPERELPTGLSAQIEMARFAEAS